MKKIFNASIITVAMLGFVPAFAQEADLYELDLEQLMEIDIYSVSKKAESLFDAPLSSSTLSKEEIANAGATSIPEALRLIPGVIVREMTNGTYDIHLRGFDNINRFGDGSSAANQITLVMIDGRPVFNNNLGGTYWEAIPVDIIDIERIEVVRGPSAPLYGPNAVAGVINIITSKVNEEGLLVEGNVAAGMDNTQIGGLRLGYKFNDKLSAQVSGNFQLRDRQDDEYFSYAQNDYVADANNRWEQALDRKGLNLMVDYQLAEDFAINLQTGMQNAEVVKSYRQYNESPLTSSVYESEYANLHITKGGFSGRVSYVTGFDDLQKEAANVQLKYDYNNFDTYLEYTFQLGEKVSLRPGINYQKSTYNDEEYINLMAGKVGVLGGEKSIESYAGSLMADIQLTEKLRTVLGGRMDKFSTPDDAYFSYEFAATYKFNSNNLLRTVISRSNSGSFLGPSFLNLDSRPFGGQSFYQGNKGLDLFTVQLFELGYRTKIGKNLELNVEIFRQTGENSNALIQTPVTADSFEFVNMPLEVEQNGITLSANYVPSSKIQLKPFVTFQKTTSDQVASSLSVFGLNDLGNEDNDQTPAVYGGFYFNAKLTDKLTFNLNPYYMSEQQQYSFYDNVNPATSAGQIEGRLIVNAKVNYKVNNNFNVYLNGRNLLNEGKSEFYGTDRTTMLLMAGAAIKF